ncbi:hypothetical protein niasHT_005983 [Heterodera trifolii]|uniref:BTB domain-containing protein n=1 Tax=Heterodera trifolii TaxID=157864 RepID=A0ABD2LYU9_9BILA
MPSTPCPLFGTLQLELNNFLEYANEPVGSLRRGNSVNIRGMSWQLGAELTESAAEDGTKYLGLNLYCNNNCKIGKTYPVTCGQDICCQEIYGPKIANLVDVCRHLKHYTVQIVANVKPDQPCGTSLPRTDAILVKTSNDQIGVEVNINRNLLAAHSNSFNDFLANFQPPAESTSSNGGLNITLDAPSTAEHFEQLMDLLHYGDCVLEESDFVAQYFLQNLEIIEQLSDGAKIALKQRIKELLQAAQ